MATKEVAKATAGEVLVLDDDDLLSEGTGLESVGTEDYALPFLRIIQSGSPQLKKSDPNKYIDGAEEGMLFNTLTNEYYKGDEGVAVIPCAYTKKYIEWVPINKGGGFVRDDHSATVMNQTKKSENGKFLLPNENEIVETSQYFLILVEDEENPQQILLSCTSTQLTFARRWNTMLRTAQVKNKEGTSVLAPMFSYIYRLKTAAQSNNFGTWHGLSIERERPTPLPIARIAKDFMVAARAGEIEVKQEGALDEVEDENSKIPF